MKKIQAEVEAFLREYEEATNSHYFDNVRKLLLKEAIYLFSDGTHRGIKEIENAFVTTWNKIKNETYSICEVEWIVLKKEYAACIYNFHWKGYVAGKLKQGNGRGTNILVKRNDRWYMLHEHLSTL